MTNFSDLSSKSGRSELLCQKRQTLLQETRFNQTILNDNLICSTNLQRKERERRINDMVPRTRSPNEKSNVAGSGLCTKGSDMKACQ